MPTVSDKAARLFRTSKAEIERMHRLAAGLSPKRTLAKSALHGRDKARGFRTSDVLKIKGI